MRVDVISVATPKGLFRAICPTFSGNNAREMVDILVKSIGITNLHETEWRGGIYIMPDYLTPGTRWEHPAGGVFLYPWVTRSQKSKRDPHFPVEKHDQESIWNDPKKRYTLNGYRKFVTRPNGWIRGTDS